jgi:hypothetical protein
MTAGDGWVLSGWGPGLQMYWSEAENAWVSRDRATVYPARPDAEARLASAPPAPFIRIRTVIGAAVKPSTGIRQSVWPKHE